MEKVSFEVKVFDNYIEIIPNTMMQDNSIYEIKLKNIKELNGKRELEPVAIKLCTALTPAYTTIQAVKSLIEDCNVPEDIILFHIREASKYADYASGTSKIDSTEPAFEVTQFVKYKASYECLLRFYVEKASAGGVNGQLADVQFENDSKMPDISLLLKDLKSQAQQWLDAIRGFKFEGRSKPVSALRGSKAVTPPVMTDLTLDYNRGVK